MAEAVVSMMVETLGSLLIEEVKMIHGVSDQVRDLRDELWWMQCFLRDADAKQYHDHRVRTWVREIKDIAYDAGDVPESFIAGVESRSGGSILDVLKRFTCFVCEGIARHNVGSSIEGIEARISKLTTRLQMYGIQSLSEDRGSLSNFNQRETQLRRSYSYIDRYDFVGLKEDVENLVKHLVNGNCPVIAIYGMGSLGKTTLAKRIYHFEEVKNHFERCVWVCISQQWDLTNILHQILDKSTGGRESNEIYQQRDVGVLIEKISKIQREKRCLVVLDDIWSNGAWDCLEAAFPFENMLGKLLVTSRSKEVALHINASAIIHQPRLLNTEECLELLLKKSSTMPDDPDIKKKETLATEMVKECSGLPLAVIALGGILAANQNLNEWQRVHDSIKSYIRRGAGVRKDDGVGGGVSNILGLSYNDLPYQLKPCFLYLSKDDEDKEIKTDSLYQTWMAEGMILSEDRRENESMMDVAESYLDELAQRCMVEVQITERLDRLGRFKSCRLHDLMRDLSVSKANKENFFHTVDFRSKNNPEESVPSFTNSKIRRLVVFHDDDHSNSRNFSLDDEADRSLRSLSFVIETFSDVPHSMPPMVKSKLKIFKMLRVLEIKGLKPPTGPNTLSNIKGMLEYYALPKGIGKLVHLRYFSLKYSFLVFFPSSMKNCKQLQTLYLKSDFILYSGCHSNMLAKMRQLQHLYLPREVRIYKTAKLQLDSLSKLETLENFNTKWCDSKGFYNLVKLRRLTAKLTDSKEGEQVTVSQQFSSPTYKILQNYRIQV